MEEQLKELQDRVARLESATPGKKEKRTRKPNAFNIFMSEEIGKVKEAEPGISHKEAFSKAAAHWGAHKNAATDEE